VASQPLDGVRVLDFTRLLPGAYATLLLADLGAEVIKIEDPRGGDPARLMPPSAGGTNAYFELLNRNKRSVTIDLRAEQAGAIVDALASRADVVVESFRPQTARRLRVDAASVRARHPRLIHTSISGFGQSGPTRAAHDINFEALSGLLTLRQPPQVPGLLVGDIAAAMNAAAGILASLYQRERTGMGASIDVAISDATLMWVMFPAARQLAGDQGTMDLPVDGSNACYNVYRTADDRYLALGALEPKFWEAFCATIGRSDLTSLQYAEEGNRHRVLEEVQTLMRSRTQAEWLELFDDADVCLTAVRGVVDALADPNATSRGMVARSGDRTYIRSPILVTMRDASPSRVEVTAAPRLGEHTDAALAEAGIDAAARTALRSRGVI
jgi:crotonobetainyl-CoA:carnitine CoA-transferase CaiB-like acyl-CoA transferase